MKTKSIYAFMALLLIGECMGQTTYYSNQYGQAMGSATTIGNTTYYNGRYGQPLGTATTYGNRTTYANPNGQVIGGIPQPPPPSHPSSNAIGGVNNLPSTPKSYWQR